MKEKEEEEPSKPKMEIRYNKYKEPPRCTRCGRPSSLTETEVGKLVWWCYYCETPLMSMPM